MSKTYEMLATGFAYFYSGAFVITFLVHGLAAVGLLLVVLAGLLGMFN